MFEFFLYIDYVLLLISFPAADFIDDSCEANVVPGKILELEILN